MSNYTRGREKEYEVMKRLREEGYECIRTAGSHGPFDVVAIGPQGVRFVQVKRVRPGTNWRREYEKAKEALFSLPRLDGISYEVWVWKDREGWAREAL